MGMFELFLMRQLAGQKLGYLALLLEKGIGLPLHVMAALEAAIHSADCEMDGRVKPAHDMVWIAAI